MKKKRITSQLYDPVILSYNVMKKINTFAAYGTFIAPVLMGVLLCVSALSASAQKREYDNIIRIMEDRIIENYYPDTLALTPAPAQSSQYVYVDSSHKQLLGILYMAGAEAQATTSILCNAYQKKWNTWAKGCNFSDATPDYYWLAEAYGQSDDLTPVIGSQKNIIASHLFSTICGDDNDRISTYEQDNRIGYRNDDAWYDICYRPLISTYTCDRYEVAEVVYASKACYELVYRHKDLYTHITEDSARLALRLQNDTALTAQEKQALQRLMASYHYTAQYKTETYVINKDDYALLHYGTQTEIESDTSLLSVLDYMGATELLCKKLIPDKVNPTKKIIDKREEEFAREKDRYRQVSYFSLQLEHKRHRFDDYFYPFRDNDNVYTASFKRPYDGALPPEGDRKSYRDFGEVRINTPTPRMLREWNKFISNSSDLNNP
jgi:hypothetical protein